MNFFKKLYINLFYNELDFLRLSCSGLTEKFIREFQDKVNWDRVSEFSKLSEEFISEFQDKVNWLNISQYQILSEEFIREFEDKVDWNCIANYQKVSEKFSKEFDISRPDENSWLYADLRAKLNYLKQTEFKIVDDKYIIGYIQNKKYPKVKSGDIYISNCDCNLKEEFGFGLYVWANLIYDYSKVRVNIIDVGAIVQNDNVIRCFKFEVLEN